MSDQLRRLYASSVDGRAHNARFAQNQLKRLFDALVEGKSQIKAALRSDTSYLPAEVEAEYYLTLASVREQYNSISITKALEDEYSIANNKDHPLRRSAVGCVYIVPGRHTPLYATVAPLCAAIAAGNCVAVEVCNPSRRLVCADTSTAKENVVRTECTAPSRADSSTRYWDLRCIGREAGR
jgi:acyl-CoA reductase-like NAD-dependent aldehyde dehydrogenase